MPSVHPCACKCQPDVHHVLCLNQQRSMPFMLFRLHVKHTSSSSRRCATVCPLYCNVVTIGLRAFPQQRNTAVVRLNSFGMCVPLTWNFYLLQGCCGVSWNRIHQISSYATTDTDVILLLGRMARPCCTIPKQYLPAVRGHTCNMDRQPFNIKKKQYTGIDARYTLQKPAVSYMVA